MRKITLAAVADQGLVRLGAGIRKPGLRPTAPATRPAPVAVPAAVADSGKVRLGAGIRRG
ncbi:hypothetical protein [Paracraurococcus ruber]|uniref:Uncharacterized protein n=1 Tax=Paracraurococcus ruber TaxID=77675 RepID=A0ABS1CS56_9PROT|nr:hypothetical protein [Paracraurococcus ruber]MBK1657293.1 hypothetical protein [Paracraurococcus ruber]TDG33438.1 hypothetical protein E2C05_03565 [Paracraurococcus ruber]